MKSSSTLLYALAGIFVVILIGVAVNRAALPSENDPLAACLTEKDVKMYGAWWCPHCQKQKELFGRAFKKITYVECSPGRTRNVTQECLNADIKGYPTWVFPDSTRLGGVRTLEELAARAGCGTSSEEPETP